MDVESMQKTVSGCNNHYCPYCNKLFVSDEFVTLHVIRMHVHNDSEGGKDNGAKDEPLLEQVSSSLPSAENNMYVPEQETAYQCPYCEIAFDKSDLLNNHMQKMHDFDKSGENHLSDDGDSGTSTLPERANDSGEEAVSPSPSYLCSLCSTNFDTAEDLACHMTDTHIKKALKANIDDLGGNLLFCAQCNHHFPTSSELQSHVKLSHSGTKRHCCNECGKFLTSPQGLKKHMRSHTGERPYQCKVCDKSFMQSGHLQAHTRLHTKERPYKCPQCELAFTTSSAMRRHVNLHTGFRPFPCGMCQSAFNTSWHLKQHVREKHLGIKSEKVHICTECGKRCGRPHDLSLHMQMHTGIKLYKCNQCDRSFCRSTLLKNHRNRFHAEDSAETAKDVVHDTEKSV